MVYRSTLLINVMCMCFTHEIPIFSHEVLIISHKTQPCTYTTLFSKIFLSSLAFKYFLIKTKLFPRYLTLRCLNSRYLIISLQGIPSSDSSLHIQAQHCTSYYNCRSNKCRQNGQLIISMVNIYGAIEPKLGCIGQKSEVKRYSTD